MDKDKIVPDLSVIASISLSLFTITAAAFYFCGSAYKVSLARRFGFNDQISNGSFHDTIALGAGIAIVPAIFSIIIFFVSSIFLYMIVRNRAFFVKHERMLLRRYLATSVGIFLGLFLCSGMLFASRETSRISSNIDGKCADCRVYKTANKSYLGIAALQDNERFYIATKDGLIPLRKDNIVNVSRLNKPMPTDILRMIF